MMDQEKIKQGVRLILEGIGEDISYHPVPVASLSHKP